MSVRGNVEKITEFSIHSSKVILHRFQSLIHLGVPLVFVLLNTSMHQFCGHSAQFFTYTSFLVIELGMLLSYGAKPTLQSVLLTLFGIDKNVDFVEALLLCVNTFLDTLQFFSEHLNSVGDLSLVLALTVENSLVAIEILLEVDGLSTDNLFELVILLEKISRELFVLLCSALLNFSELFVACLLSLTNLVFQLLNLTLAFLVRAFGIVNLLLDLFDGLLTVFEAHINTIGFSLKFALCANVLLVSVLAFHHFGLGSCIPLLFCCKLCIERLQGVSLTIMLILQVSELLTILNNLLFNVIETP
mmetsp:Transcript_11175/g.41794  ORF Transcript_11175/g.41794 Transcript_11175/m.41794 type:complete len:303 (+) Transcript_11175:3153-4061(+)